MPIDLVALAREVKPENFKLLFGAGSSVPSGGLTGAQLAKKLCDNFNIEHDPSLSLSDIATLVELSHPRRKLIEYIQSLTDGLKPTSGLLTLPLFDWNGIFTTNYDTLVEQSYGRAKRELNVYSSNFDFGDSRRPDIPALFKMHGTIGQDRSVGHQASMILTNSDYDSATQYRDLIFDRLIHETSRGHLLIIGHALADRDLNAVFEESLRRRKESGCSARLFALVYTPDNNRAKLIEARGFTVCFASLDKFFAQLMAAGPERRIVLVDSDDALGRAPHIRPSTLDVLHELDAARPNATPLFNGSPASYGDIRGQLTFKRDLTSTIDAQLAGDDAPVAYLLGSAGVGKTTLCRQVLASLASRGFLCWEHRPDFRFDASAWIAVAEYCSAKKLSAALFVDNTHVHLRGVDALIDAIASKTLGHFRLLLASSPGHWHPRSKTPNIYALGKEYGVNALTQSEINSLLDLFERNKEIAALVEPSFGGFSRGERFRRLSGRCHADMFVCMKNIFSFDALDDIILRDYATLETELQDVYRTVAAMEASNIRVHRQLVMRILGIPAAYISGALDRLVGIVTEYDIEPKNGIYRWQGRHQVISEIILKYKYHDQAELNRLYDLVIGSINPTYEVERMTINELCDIHTGVGRIQDRERQNVLYRKMISVAPSQRPPRHRLIYNLIKSGKFDIASNEIRVFETELRRDAPILRYKAMLLVERADPKRGLMVEDRLAILSEAAAIASKGLQQYASDRSLHAIHCEIGLGIFKLSGKWNVFDSAIEKLSRAEQEYLDPELGRLRTRMLMRRDTIAVDATPVDIDYEASVELE